VVIGVPAIDAPEDKLVGQRLVVVVVDAEVLTADRALTAEVAVLLQCIDTVNRASLPLLPRNSTPSGNLKPPSEDLKLTQPV
jgi:hypothetical protein